MGEPVGRLGDRAVASYRELAVITDAARSTMSRTPGLWSSTEDVWGSHEP
ncbi:MAG: hypothetical protein M3133_04705 [Actinomycetota bacterium]|nr:hypothetical protein [Actinomycetota bacterium]